MRSLATGVILACAAVAAAQGAIPGVPGVEGTPEYRQALRARASLQSVPPAGSDVRDRAGSILSREEFRDPGAAQQRPLMEETSQAARGLWDRIVTGINRLIASLAGGSGPAAVIPVPPWVWIAVAIFVAGGLIVGYAWGAKGRKVLADDLLDGEEGLSADEWLDKADVLQSGGHFREAFRCIYVALLVRLAEHGVAQFRRYETNWEHVRRAEASPVKLRGLDLRSPTRLFDSMWYGRKPVGAAEVAELRELYVRSVRTLQGRVS